MIRAEAFGDNRIDPADAGVQTTWIAYTVLRQAVESLGDGEVTADTVSAALDGGLKVTTGNLTPTLRWKFQDTLASVGLPAWSTRTSPSTRSATAASQQRRTASRT